jgi:hypothetical protein
MAKIPTMKPRAVQMAGERYQHGSQGAVSMYVHRYAAYHAMLERLVLPPRGPRGSKQNQKRALTIQAAMHQLKVATAPKQWVNSHNTHRCKLCQVEVQCVQ